MTSSLLTAAPWWRPDSGDAMAIRGGAPLVGTYPISGAKNAVLPLMVSALLTPHLVSLRNVPATLDVAVLATLLQRLGCEMHWSANDAGLAVTICADRLQPARIDPDLVTRMRASVLLLGALIGRCGEARLPLPGGDAIGQRGIDFHIAGLRAMGATVELDGGMIHATARDGLRGADILLLACRDTESGWQLHAVPAASCQAWAMPALSSSRDLSTVQWPLASDTLLAYGVAAEAAAALLADRAAAGTAALLIGLADRMLAMAAAYAKERQQFGKPIGSFQAVKHLLANARVALEFARPATYRAAWSLATAQPTLSHDASMAKAMASDAADQAARVALQVHGAIGYTWECDLHFFMKRTWALSRAWGDAATHRRLVLAYALGR